MFSLTYSWVLVACGWSFVAYSKLAWSLLLTVEIRFGLVAYGGKSVLSLLLNGSPRPEIGFQIGFFHLQFPHRK